MSHSPKVSVVTIAYNQEKYIAQALDSFLMQQTDFSFEIVVADDCSTDQTAKIIQTYAENHPDIIRPVIRSKNVGAQNNSIAALRAAKGEYLALCEGDDYWTDPKKLQLQADLLDQNSDVALCFHPVKVFFEDGSQPDFIYPDIKNKSTYTVDELLEWNFIQTNAVMYRRQKYDLLPNDILPLDWYLHLYHAQFGKIGYINRVMSAYRKHAAGIWFDTSGNIDELWKKHGLAHLGLYVELLKLYGGVSKSREVLNGHIHQLLNNLVRVDKMEHGILLNQAIDKYPELLEEYIQQLGSDLAKQSKTLADQSNQIQAMKASKFWKARNAVAKLIGKKPI